MTVDHHKPLASIRRQTAATLAALLTAAAATVALAIVATVALAVVAPTAEAASKTINGFIGGPPIGDAGAPGGQFGSPRDVAVYTAGDSDPANDKIFVVEGSESGNNRVQRLDVHGNFELMWGRDVVITGAPGDTGAGFEVCSEAVGGAASCKDGERGSAEGEFANPHGLAVDQSTGHVFVSDRYNLRVQEFDLDGGFVRAWGWGVATGAEAFEVCTADCRQGLEGAGDGQFTSAEPEGFPGTGIAVDPVNGDVFVADPANSRVQQFTSTGDFVAAFGVLDDDSGFEVGEFGFGEPLRLTVDSNHIVYISDATDFNNNSNRVQRYDADADVFLDPIAGEPTPGAPLVEGTTVGLEIDPDSDGGGPDEEHLLVARDRFDGDTVVQELDIPTPPTDPVTVVVDNHVYETDPSSPGLENDRTVNGIGFSPTSGDLYIVTPTLVTPQSGNGTFTGCQANSCSGLIVLSSNSGPLDASVVAADAATTSIAVDGIANAGGGVASYRFELSTDGATWQDSGVGGYVSGLDDHPVSGELTGLDPNTFYRVRLVVRKQTGITTDVTTISNELVVLTDAAPPEVQTLGSTQRTDHSARLRGRVDPNGAQTTYRFEYGPAGGSFDQHVPVPDASAGSGQTLDLVVADVDGLLPSTAYQYRIVATNFVGTSVGETVTFTTEPTTLPPPPPGRGYELVSPAHKIAGVGVGAWYDGPGQIGAVGAAAYERERFAAHGLLGSVLVDGAYAYGNDWALAQRTPQGWNSSPATSRVAHGSQNFAVMGLQAATEDLTLTSYNSNGHVFKLFPEMEPWNGGDIGEVMIVRDWTSGRWELFGPLDPAQKSPGTPIGSSTQGFAADGSAMVSSSGGVRGLAGPGDPTNQAFPDLQSGGSVYLDEVTGPFSDEFPGDDGERELVNVCTGDGAARTVVPSVDGSGKLEGLTCPAVLPDLPGRDARLISPRGAAIDAPQAGSFGQGEDAEGAVSADGSRVVFMSPDPHAGGAAPCEGTGVDSECPTQLFVWQRGPGGNPVTRWISQSEVADQDASLMAPALFEGASRDGDKVFFRTMSPLTADDPNGAGAAPPAGGVTTGVPDPLSWDLYMYDLPDGPDGDPSTPDGDPTGGDLVRISAGPDSDGDCNSGLSGSTALRFVSADASRAYFTCAAALPGVPTPDSGTITSPGGSAGDSTAANLYAYDTARPAALRWRFVARLPRTSDLGRCATVAGGRGGALGGLKDGDVVVTATLNCVRGTADGSLVTFFTDGQLTADDPDAVSGDVYAYDAARDELTRVSAPQGGVGGTYPCATQDSDAPCYGDPGIESSIGSVLHRLGVATRPDGRRLVFFESRSRLVADDTDQAYDVYQWSDGELSLISTGATDDPDGVFYAGNDRSGLNVYLATRERLTWQDKDAVLDVYSARIGGGIPEPPPPPDCDLSTDSCQGGGVGPDGPPRGSNTDKPVGGNLAPGGRVKVSIVGLSRRARLRAARTGVLAVKLRASGPGVVLVSARARLGGKVKRVAGARKRLEAAGSATVRLRLSRPARRRLGAGRELVLRVSARPEGARGSAIGVTLKRGGR